VIAIASPGPDITSPSTAAVDLIAAVLDQHHTTTIKVGAGAYRWACLCGANPGRDVDPTDYATAWRAARNHEAEQVIEALKAAA
jgi:hypothetical protein